MSEKPQALESTPATEPSKELRRKKIQRKINSAWDHFEVYLGNRLTFAPSLWSWAKLLLCTPFIATGLWVFSFSPTQRVSDLANFEWLLPSVVLWCFVLSLTFDLFRRARVSALRETRKGLEGTEQESMGHLYEQDLSGHSWIDRLCDLPLSGLATYCLMSSPHHEQSLGTILSILLLLRFGLETLTSIFLWLGRGPNRTRLRTVISELSLYVIIALILGLNTKILNFENARFIIGLQVIFSGLVFAYQLRLLQKRFIADTLSGLNFICGLISIYYSSQGRFETSLLFLLLGGAFDGFDGAAARKFGGTKFGVYSDDIADGMNYGIAPGYAVYCLMGGIEGLIIGAFYAIFTISRLVYFTLNKEQGDPGYFAGVPSPVGGMMVMSSVVLFVDKPLWVSFLVGVSSTLMVSFKTPYVHIFRAFSWRSPERKRQALIGAPLFLISFLLVTIFYGTKGAAAVILFGACGYGFIPSLLSFYLVLFPPKLNIVEDNDQ